MTHNTALEIVTKRVVEQIACIPHGPDPVHPTFAFVFVTTRASWAEWENVLQDATFSASRVSTFGPVQNPSACTISGPPGQKRRPPRFGGIPLSGYSTRSDKFLRSIVPASTIIQTVTEYIFDSFHTKSKSNTLKGPFSHYLDRCNNTHVDGRIFKHGFQRSN